MLKWFTLSWLSFYASFQFIEKEKSGYHFKALKRWYGRKNYYFLQAHMKRKKSTLNLIYTYIKIDYNIQKLWPEKQTKSYKINIT